MDASNETPVEPVDDGFDDDDLDDEVLVARKRIRLWTPLTVLFGLCAVAAVGVYGGIELQKHYGGSSSSASAFGGFGRNGGTATTGASLAGATGAQGATGARGVTGGGGTRGGGFFGGGGGGATVGTVKAVDGTALYVTDFQGNTVKVTTSAGSQYTRSVAGTFKDIHPGDTVIVRGQAGQSGTIAAESVTISSSAAGGSGGGSGFPNLPGAGGTSSGTTGSSGGGFPALPGAGN